MSSELLQQVSYRSVIRNWIRHWHDSLEPKITVLIRHHHTPTIRPIMIWTLNVIVTCRIRFPDIDLDARNGLASDILDSANNQHGISFGVMGDQITVILVLGFMSVKWAQQRSVSGTGGFRMVNAVD